MASSLPAAPPAGFGNELVLSGLVEPVDLAFLPDGRALVLQKGGEIVILDPQANPPVASSYLTLSDVDSAGERGLIAITLDPNFAGNGHFYLYWTQASRQRFRVSRFTHAGSTADSLSELLIWENPLAVSGCCHYGGGLDIGPEGAIYLSTGDVFEGNQSQDLARANGKILRFNTDGSIPADNPWAGDPLALPEVWARGLRNAFRASWDIAGNRLYVGEVGGNNQATASEDIHVGEAGANYGWPYCEGPCNDPLYVDPLYAYPHNGAGASVTGGFVYRGASFPAIYQGAYFFADFVRQFIRYLVFDTQGRLVGDFDFDPAAGAVVSLKEGPDGSLYYLDIVAGSLRRVVYQTNDLPPLISQASASPAQGTAPLLVNFAAVASDPEGLPLSYVWLFGDGQQAPGAQVAHAYVANGPYLARLAVSDGVNTSWSADIPISVGQPPDLGIVSPVATDPPFRAGQDISYSAVASDPDGSLAASDYAWTILFRHNEHTHPADSSVGLSGSFHIEDRGHDFGDATGYEFHVTVTDADGLSASAMRTVYPDKVNVTFTTTPPVAALLLDEIERSTPFTLDTLIDFRHTVSVPQELCIGTTRYVLDAWSDGGAATHEFVVPAADMTLAAMFSPAGSCLRVSNGLQLLYDFSSGSGNQVRDRSGLSPALDLDIAEPAAVSWQPGGGLTIDSPTVIATGAAATRLRSALQASDALTLEAWVIPADPPGSGFGPGRILALSQDGFPNGGNFVLGQAHGTSTAFALRLRTSTTNRYGSPELLSPAGSGAPVLTHLLYTRAADAQERLYIDGVEVSQGTRAGDFGNWDDYRLALGNEPDGLRAWLGTLRLVAVYDRVLTPAEIAINFAAGPDNAPPPDTDGDGLPDTTDNCIERANPTQGDADGDGYGNACDADFSNDGLVNFADLAILRSGFGSNDPLTDLDDSGFVNFADLGIFRQLFGSPPGPSALAP